MQQTKTPLCPKCGTQTHVSKTYTDMWFCGSCGNGDYLNKPQNEPNRLPDIDLDYSPIQAKVQLIGTITSLTRSFIQSGPHKGLSIPKFEVDSAPNCTFIFNHKEISPYIQQFSQLVNKGDTVLIIGKIRSNQYGQQVFISHAKILKSKLLQSQYGT